MKKLALIVLVICLTATLTGCGSSQATAEDSIENALTSLQTLDYAEAQNYFGDEAADMFATNDEDFMQTEEFMKLIMQNFEFKVISSEENGDNATVTVEVTNVDMSTIMADFMTEVFADAFSTALLPESEQPTEEELNAKYVGIFTELFASEDLELVTNTFEVSLTRVDGEWEIDYTDELIDNVLGGLLSVADSFSELD